MIVSNCLDEIKPENPTHLGSTTLEERELLQSIAKLLYKTKSVRKTIKLIDTASTYSSELINHITNHNQESYPGC